MKELFQNIVLRYDGTCVKIQQKQGRQEQEDCEIKATLCYVATSCLDINNKQVNCVSVKVHVCAHVSIYVFVHVCGG